MISCLRTEKKDFIPEQLLSFCGCLVGEPKQKYITLFNPGHVTVNFNVGVINERGGQDEEEIGQVLQVEPEAGQLKPGHRASISVVFRPEKGRVYACELEIVF